MRRARAVIFCSAASVGGAVSGCERADPGARWPRADVELVTDDLGITHVYAGDDEDAFYGAGYALARDRPLQIELARRRALGTQAEVLGERAFKDDVGARAIGFARLGARDLAKLRAEAPDEARLADAWTAGVNARLDEIRDGRAPRPYGFGPDGIDGVPAPFVTEDTFAIAKLLAFALSSSLESELLATALVRVAPAFTRLVPLHQPAYDVFTMPEATPKNTRVRAASPNPDPRTALPLPHDLRWELPSLLAERGQSNNWAVSGRLSESGRPIVAGDPHQPASSPQRFWPVHMNSAERGGTLDVIGFSFAGTPTVQLGHNARVAWTATTNNADVTDLWDVRLDADRAKVLLGDGEHDVVARREVISVKGKGKGEVAKTEAHEVLIEDVPGYGVLLPDDLLPLPRPFLADGDALLLRWTGFEPSTELRAYLALDRARTVQDAERAIDRIDVGAQNFVVGDAESVGYHVHARVPDRGPGGSRPMPWRVLPGDDARTLWTDRFLGPDRLPHVRDPARGFIGTANNDPWGFTADGSVDDDPFYYSGFYSTGFRAQRIDEALSLLVAAGRKIGSNDMVALQDDAHSVLADEIVPRLAAAIGAIDDDAELAPWRGDPDVRALAGALVAWDREMRRDRGEPLVFHALLWHAAKRALVPLLPSALFGAIATRSPPYLLGVLRNVLASRFEGSDALVPAGRGALLVGALADAAAWLRARFGTVDVSRLRWGELNVCVFGHPLGGALVSDPVGVDGGSDTLKVNEASFFDAALAPRDRFDTKDVSLYRMVATFGADGRTTAMIQMARGTREDPDSPHFSDREADWIAGTPRPLAFERRDVDARARERVTLPARR